MVEDGTIAYDFYYREGEIHVHPVLDRMAFLLRPDRIRIHWVTNGRLDRTGLAPDNLFDEPGSRRGPSPLPLVTDAWNRLHLTVAGDVVDLKLNGELVYECKIDPANQRTFGLFHYADRTEARVRNIVWRGDWPGELPSPADQQLAGEGIEFLDESLAGLTAAFHHDFAKDGLPPERFGLIMGRMKQCDALPPGLLVSRPGGILLKHLRINADRMDPIPQQ